MYYEVRFGAEMELMDIDELYDFLVERHETGCPVKGMVINEIQESEYILQVMSMDGDDDVDIDDIEDDEEDLEDD